MSKKILIIGYSEKGGAGIAMRRQYECLSQYSDYDIKLWVEHKVSKNPDIHTTNSIVKKLIAWGKPTIEELYLNIFYPKRRKDFFPFFSGIVPAITEKEALKFSPDLIIVHWNNVNTISLKTLAKLNKKIPVLFVLHDMWLITGGCAYNYNSCIEFTNNCGQCPLLGSYNKKDISYKRAKYKKKFISKLNKYLVITPSFWLRENALNSSVFRQTNVKVIPYPINIEMFNYVDTNIKAHIRSKLGISTNKLVVLISLSYKQKAELYSKWMQELLKDTVDIVHWLILGGKSLLEDKLTLENITYLPYLNDEFSVSIVYNASDLYIHLSEQDNLPNSIIEALTSGVPTIAFDVGGVPDLIKDGVNGFLVKFGDVNAIIDKINFFVNNKEKLQEFSINARKLAVENFSYEVIAKKYIQVIENLIS